MTSRMSLRMMKMISRMSSTGDAADGDDNFAESHRGKDAEELGQREDDSIQLF
jgi:hypothetical protein